MHSLAPFVNALYGHQPATVYFKDIQIKPFDNVIIEVTST